LHLGLATSHGLAIREQQRQIGVNALALQLCSSLNAFPGGRDLDQHAVNVNALRLVQLNQALGPGHGGAGIKTQTGIHLGRHPTRHDGQNLAAKTHQQAVGDFVQRAAPVLRHGLAQQRVVLRLLHSLEDQRGVGGGVRGLKGFNLLEVAGIGHHGGVLFESIELVHLAIMKRWLGP